MDIEATPNWHSMFNYAIRIVEMNIHETDGQGLVVEMLRYGQRMNAQTSLHETKAALKEVKLSFGKPEPVNSTNKR
tara:strand:- start:192 stop:419 length:228 start_codon:yes stop_codon:yes gene_type:complete